MSSRRTRLLFGTLCGLLMVGATVLWSLLEGRSQGRIGAGTAPRGPEPSPVPTPAAVEPPLPPARPPRLRPEEWMELVRRLHQEGRSAELLRAVGWLEEQDAALLAANDLYVLAGDAARSAGDGPQAL